jgi:hypothetical protein
MAAQSVSVHSVALGRTPATHTHARDALPPTHAKVALFVPALCRACLCEHLQHLWQLRVCVRQTCQVCARRAQCGWCAPSMMQLGVRLLTHAATECSGAARATCKAVMRRCCTP